MSSSSGNRKSKTGSRNKHKHHQNGAVHPDNDAPLFSSNKSAPTRKPWMLPPRPPHPSSSSSSRPVAVHGTTAIPGATYDETTPLTSAQQQHEQHLLQQPRQARRPSHPPSTSYSPNHPPPPHQQHPQYLPANKVARKTWQTRCTAGVAIMTSVTALILGGLALVMGGITGSFSWFGRNSHHTDNHTAITTPLQQYDDLNRWILSDYDIQPPFADFLPALAGYYGKPLYAFYVNRGQGIASFGIESKDYPILEFQSANIAYQITPFVGFRTFVQGHRRRGRGGKRESFVVEPFAPLSSQWDKEYNDQASGTTRNSGQSTQTERPQRTMYVGSNEMQLQEVDDVHGLETNVTYIVLPEEDFGAFVRRTTFTNIGQHSLTFSVLDGLARMQPAGGDKMNGLLKTIGRTLEGFKGVYSPYDDTLQMPYYRLSTQPSDTAAVVVEEAGHWCLSVLDGTNTSLLPIVYDTTKVFGQDTTLLQPVSLYTKTIREIVDGPQYGAAKTSSAFAAATDLRLASGESVTITTYFGKAQNILNVPVIARRLLQPGFGEYKVRRSREIIQQVTAGVDTKTASKIFNAHVGQMYLDNSLRGGVASILGDVDDDAQMRNADEDNRLKVYHLFSRIHGDLERDYNDFRIMPTFFSEGPGNFRDIAQNRRNDVMFQPRIGSYNVRSFISYIQADGYNPLKIEAPSFTIENVETCRRIATTAVGEADGHRAQREMLMGILNAGPFRPGQLFQLMEDLNIYLVISRQDFIDLVAASADSNPMANYTKGYWADHWTYIVDLINGWLAVYPDWEERVLFDTTVPYFFSPASVNPRAEKYVLSTTFDGKGKHIRQLEATLDDDPEKVAFMEQFINPKTGWYELEASWQHDMHGRVFQSSPMEKLFVLATVKFATRDPYGMGIEYEGGRPGWNDANNGLVGMLGSGIPEATELNVLLRFIRSSVAKYAKDLELPVEIVELMDEIMRTLEEMKITGSSMHGSEGRISETGLRVPTHLFEYWDRVSSARELYRQKTKVTFCGKKKLIPSNEIQFVLSAWIEQVDIGLERARRFGTRGYGDMGGFGVTPTYFSYIVKKWKTNGLETTKGLPLVNATSMELNIFPMFLEGPTRMMKLLKPQNASDLYYKVQESPLKDSSLGMYLISASLKGQSFDLGREMAFAPGWLENQSVWLHMSYKYYLELLRHELFDEFFTEMQEGAMLPFVNADKYGRSVLECSSFIASSAFEDPEVQGRGFLARLSGSTAEFLSMWTLMMIGPNPFVLDSHGGLKFQLLPALPRWLFVANDDGVTSWLSFKLFGSIDVTYHHQRGEQDLFRTPPTRYVVGFRDGQTNVAEGPFVPADLADKIRRVVFVATIDVYFETTSS